VFRVLKAATAIAVVAASIGIFSGRAYAHESRMVGPYRFVVGFLSEPAFAGTTNGLDLTVTDTRNTPATPVEGLEKTLTATVSAGGVAPLSIEIKTRFGQPGKYAAYFMPTQAGQYVYSIKGKVAAQDVNEKFESGPGRFNDVESTTPLQYPVKVPGGADLATRLDSIQSTAEQTRLIALAALIVGIAAIGWGVLMRPKGITK